VTNVVLDASALIALLRSEPWAEVVRKSLDRAIISAVNYSEVLKKAVERGGPVALAVSTIEALSISIIPFDERQVAGCAALHPDGKPHGMSLADRACLALGVQRRLTVLTAERKMKLVILPIKVKLDPQCRLMSVPVAVFSGSFEACPGNVRRCDNLPYAWNEIRRFSSRIVPYGRKRHSRAGHPVPWLRGAENLVTQPRDAWTQ
jgi:ribonuclease VapC